MSEPVVGTTPSAVTWEVELLLQQTPVFDIHTHLYDPAFGGHLLWGIDELLVYHYLVAEAFRYWDRPYEEFWALPKARQAELIWDELFLKHSPISESCRGIVTTLNAFGLDARKRDLGMLRQWFSEWKAEDYITECFSQASVGKVCMSNSPFDPVEREVWMKGFSRDERFLAGLRIEPLLLNWSQAAGELRGWGFDVTEEFTGKSAASVRLFLQEWTRRMEPKYLMASLPPDFAYPDGGHATRILEEAILPHCREFGLPLALMPGVKRGLNPGLGMAGDGSALSNLAAVSNLCAAHPQNRFAVTVLARENQHELCVLARKFRNLHIFGCWWFNNTPSLIEEITRMRLELLGLSFTPQHSDARVLDQVIYKWKHTRRVLTRVLAEKYSTIVNTGWELTRAEIERDVKQLMGGGFEEFCKM